MKGTTVFKNPINIFRLIPILFVLIGLGLLAGAYFNYRSTKEFLRTALPATGEVIGYERHTDSEGEISYYPVIIFTTAEGEEIEFTSSTGSGSRGYKIGSDIALRYDPALPFNASIDTPTDLWVGTGVLGFLGVAFTIVGSFVFWVFRPGGEMDRGVFSPSNQPEVEDVTLDEDFDFDEEIEADEETEADEQPRATPQFDEPKVTVL